MKPSRLFSLLAISFLALLASACGSVGPASWPGVTVDEGSGTIYLADNYRVYALEAANGSENWRYPAKQDNKFTTFSPPELSGDGQLLFGSYNHVFYSLDPASGSLTWTFEGATNHYVASPLAEAEHIYAPNADGRMYALTSNGELAWTFGTQQPLWSQPVSDGAALYLNGMDHNIYAIDAVSGDEVWSLDLGGTLVGSPTLIDGVLYVGTLDSEVIAVNAASGRVTWRTATEGWVWGSPTFYQDQILVTDLEGQVYAFDAASGRQNWKVGTEGAITGAALVANDHIYVANENGRVLSISLDGDIEWTKTFEAKLYGPVVPTQDLLLVSQSGTTTLLIALDQNGDTVWTFEPQN